MTNLTYFWSIVCLVSKPCNCQCLAANVCYSYIFGILVYSVACPLSQGYSWFNHCSLSPPPTPPFFGAFNYQHFNYLEPILSSEHLHVIFISFLFSNFKTACYFLFSNILHPTFSTHLFSFHEISGDSTKVYSTFFFSISMLLVKMEVENE